jgi:Domain of unknown function (DUF2019)
VPAGHPDGGQWTTEDSSSATNAPSRQVLSEQQVLSDANAIGVEHDKAEQAEHDSKYKRLFYEMSDIQEELNRRPGDQRRALKAVPGLFESVGFPAGSE